MGSNPLRLVERILDFFLPFLKVLFGPSGFGLEIGLVDLGLRLGYSGFGLDLGVDQSYWPNSSTLLWWAGLAIVTG